MLPETLPELSLTTPTHCPLLKHGMLSQLALPEKLLPFLEIVIVNVVGPVPQVSLGIVPVHVPSQGDGQKLRSVVVLVPHPLVATSTKLEKVSGISPIIFALTSCCVFPLKV